MAVHSIRLVNAWLVLEAIKFLYMFIYFHRDRFHSIKTNFDDEKKYSDSEIITFLPKVIS